MGGEVGRLLPPRRKRSKRTHVHLVVTDRVDKPQATPARVTIDRGTGLVTIRRARAKHAWRIPLAAAVEILMARIMRDEAQRLLGIVG
jgi:hypothetical protein